MALSAPKLASPNITVREVSPELAHEWLKLNIAHNRPLKPDTISRYAADMAAGQWRLTGDAIRFDRHSQLIDGQHRLEACMMANRSFTTFVVTDLDDNVLEAIDQGVKRRINDALHMQGWAINNNHIAALNWIHKYNAGSLYTKHVLSVAKARDELLDNPGIIETTNRVAGSKGFRTLGHMPAMSAAWHLIKQLNPYTTDVFFEAVESGTGLMVGDPAHTLRERLLAARMSKNRRKVLSREETFVFIIKAWNAFKRHEKIYQLRWAANGMKPEGVPEIE